MGITVCRSEALLGSAEGQRSGTANIGTDSIRIEVESAGNGDKREVDSTLAAGTVDSCPICLDDFSPSDGVVVLECRHCFHVECEMLWIRRGRYCPVCKSSIRPSDAVEMFETSFQSGGCIINEERWKSLGGEDNYRDLSIGRLMTSGSSETRGTGTASHEPQRTTQEANDFPFGRSRLISLWSHTAFRILSKAFSVMWSITFVAAAVLTGVYFFPACEDLFDSLLISNLVWVGVRTVLVVTMWKAHPRHRRRMARVCTGGVVSLALLITILWMSFVLWFVIGRNVTACKESNAVKYYVYIALASLDCLTVGVTVTGILIFLCCRSHPRQRTTMRRHHSR
mmetsp:Transcript_17399/g.43345  ORF Transcript_17399/g.43345 Transcript_17399/m.43345 type:complete len:340 (+) Transcript_17399:438-1457(+)